MRWLGVIGRDVPSLFLSAPWSGKAQSGNDPGVASAEGGSLTSPTRAWDPDSSLSLMLQKNPEIFSRFDSQ